jgi:pantetheine-phosphate adenylyltransferase
MALMNRRLMRRLEIAFLMPDQKYTYLNSTLVKEVARHGGAITGLVPPLVERKLRERLRSQARATRGPAAKRR